MDNHKLTVDLLEHLQAAGFELWAWDDGGERELIGARPDLDDIAAALSAVDESTLEVGEYETPGGMVAKVRALWLVYGNAPHELVCDYSDTPALTAAVESWTDKIERQGVQS